MLFYAMLCHAMPCYAMPCYAKACGELMLQGTEGSLQRANASFRLDDRPVAQPEQIFGKCVALQRRSPGGAGNAGHPARASVRWLVGPGVARLAITHALVL